MQNIPTDLLRTFLAVLDLKGFTRAGERLGRSQPAISLQIKRLQDLVGVPLFDRMAGQSGVTDYGRMVEAYARRMLALNDELVDKIASRSRRGRIRIGIPREFADELPQKLLSDSLVREADLNFDVQCATNTTLQEGLQDGAFDLIFTVSQEQPAEGLVSGWSEPLRWVGDAALIKTNGTPLRLVALYPDCPCRETVEASLTAAARPFEVVYSTQTYAGVDTAVRTSFGLTALPERIARKHPMMLPETIGLPPLKPLKGGVYLAGDLSDPMAGPVGSAVSSGRQSELAPRLRGCHEN